MSSMCKDVADFHELILKDHGESYPSLISLDYCVERIRFLKEELDNEMIYWAALGMFFKAASWSISFIFLAKGTGKLFFWNELVSSLYTLVLNILGYYYYGLAGLGISFMIGYMLYLIQVFLVCKTKFEFSFNRAFMQMFIIQFLLAMGSFIAIKSLIYPYPYIVGTLIILISSVYSFRELDKRIGVKALIDGLLKKYI